MTNLHLSNSSLIFSSNSLQKTRRQTKKTPEMRLLAENRFQGSLSSSVRSQMKKLLSKWDYSIQQHNKVKESGTSYLQRKFGFITLTIPAQQKHSHKQVKRLMLNQFTIWLSKSNPGINYLWKAELQSNGNIHFHILVDLFVPWQLIRRKWNQILDNNGYIEAFRSNMLEKNCDIYDNYKKNYYRKNEETTFKAWKHGINSNWSDPNTTDIHNLSNCKSVISYISKYITKPVLKDDSEESDSSCELSGFGRIWGYSDALNAIPNLSCTLSDAEVVQVNKIIKNSISHTYDSDFFSVKSIKFSDFNFIRDILVQNFFFYNYDVLQKIRLW